MEIDDKIIEEYKSATITYKRLYEIQKMFNDYLKAKIVVDQKKKFSEDDKKAIDLCMKAKYFKNNIIIESILRDGEMMIQKEHEYIELDLFYYRCLTDHYVMVLSSDCSCHLDDDIVVNEFEFSETRIESITIKQEKDIDFEKRRRRLHPERVKQFVKIIEESKKLQDFINDKYFTLNNIYGAVTKYTGQEPCFEIKNGKRKKLK